MAPSVVQSEMHEETFNLVDFYQRKSVGWFGFAIYSFSFVHLANNYQVSFSYCHSDVEYRHSKNTILALQEFVIIIVIFIIYSIFTTLF